MMPSRTFLLRTGLVCVIGGLAITKSGGYVAPSPIELTIAAPSDSLDGSTAELTATLTNTCDHDVKMVQIRGDSSVSYEATVRNIEHNRLERERDTQSDTSSDDAMASYSMSSITLKPGEQIKEMIELGKMYDLNESGTYAIRVVRHVPEAEGTGVTHLTSNEITVEITAHSESKATVNPQ